MGTGPVIMMGLPSSALNLVVPKKVIEREIFEEHILVTSTEENNIFVVDNNHAVTGQWNGELVHGGPDTVIPNLGGE